MTIKTFEVNPLGVNCYVVSDETKEAAIIDCGCFAESEWADIKKYITSNDLQIKHLLNTHLHFDHVWGNAFVYRDLGLCSAANYEDLSLYERMDDQIRSVVGRTFPHPPMPPLGTSLTEGSEITFGTTTITVIATPGHSRGSVCFYSASDNILFSGDTLFCGSCGRTDLEGGSAQSIMESLQRLATLPDNTQVMCGHGGNTTIEKEKAYNPYMQGA